MRRPKRRTFYVDRHVQFEMGKRIVLHWVCFLIVSFLLAAALQFLMGDPFQSFSSLISSVFAHYGLFFLIMLSLIPVFVYDSIKVSNRFAGPMVQVKRTITAVADGEHVKPLRFRKGDMWRDLESEFNRMLERFMPAASQDQAAEQPASACDSADRSLVEADASLDAALND